MEKVTNVDLKFLRNDAEYFCIQGLVKVVEEEIEKTEKGEALRLAQIASFLRIQGRTSFLIARLARSDPRNSFSSV